MHCEIDIPTEIETWPLLLVGREELPRIPDAGNISLPAVAECLGNSRPRTSYKSAGVQRLLVDILVVNGSNKRCET